MTPTTTPATTLDRLAIVAGFAGSLVITAGSVMTALAYTGSKGQPFSPLNHFVSELGELFVSDFAPVFNTGLIIGGVAFAVFMIGLASARVGRLRLVYGVLGVIAGVAGSLVGVFPMNYLDQHAAVALTFFNLGWIVVLLASIDFVRRPDPRFPGWLAIIGVATVVAFVAFLITLSGEADGLAHPDERLAFWPLTTFEWLLVAGIMLWTFLTSATWWRAIRRAGR